MPVLVFDRSRRQAWMAGVGLAIANPEYKEQPTFGSKEALHMNWIGQFEWRECFSPRAWTQARRNVLASQEVVQSRLRGEAGSLQVGRYKARSTWLQEWSDCAEYQSALERQ